MSDDDDGEPLGDLADEVATRRDAADADVFEEAFEDVGLDLDSEAVWDQLSVEAEDAPETGERVVDKHTYCQRCAYFSDPPTVACEHEGTEITELADSEHFRVVNCPVVAEREHLEDED